MTHAPAQAGGKDPETDRSPAGNPWPARAFDLVTDVSKQVITLSTGMIALGIALLDLGIDVHGVARWLLVLSWGGFVLAIMAAIATLLASIWAPGAGELGHAARTPTPATCGSSVLLSWCCSRLRCC